MKSKLAYFWEQYSYIFAFALCLILIVASAFVPALAYLALIVFVASACYFDANKTFGLLFLFLFTEIILSSFVFTAFIFVFGFGAVLFKAIKAKRIKWEKSLIIPLSCIGIIFIMCFFVHNVTENFSIVPFRYVIILLALLSIHILRDEFDIKEIFRLFYIALFSTCLASAIFIFPNPTGITSFVSDEYEYFRFKGLTGHPNTLYAYPLCAIGMAIFLYFKEKINLVEFLFVVFVSMGIGFVTWSKAFLLIAAIAALIFFIYSFKKGSNYVFVEILIILSITGLGYLLFKEQLIKLYDRFFISFTDSIFNMLTTGRYEIWIYYANLWAENALNIIFGIGANFLDPSDINNPLNYVHCAYLDILVKFGVIGTITIGVFIGYLIYKMPKNNLKFINFIPLIIIMLNMVDEEFMSSKIIALLVAIMCLFEQSKMPSESEDDEAIENVNESETIKPRKTKKENNLQTAKNHHSSNNKRASITKKS